MEERESINFKKYASGSRADMTQQATPLFPNQNVVSRLILMEY
jgi:hypothetical protein